MKNIIVLTNESSERQPSFDFLSSLGTEYTLFTAMSEPTAMTLALEHDAILIIYDLASFGDYRVDSLMRINHSVPYIPSIAITDEARQDSENLLESGLGHCFTHPLNLDDVMEHTRDLIHQSRSGQVRGMPVHILLQMVESDRKTCTLKVQGIDDTGYIFIQKGEVVAAETSEQKNEDAIYSMLTWQDALAEIRYFNGQRSQEINKPLISLIMEGFRLKDERESLDEKQQSQQKPILELKHISTTGNRLALDIGSKIKMEFDEVDSPLVSTLVGMVPDKYLVVTTPNPFSVVETALSSASRIVIKYLHFGKLYMFKTKLIKAIDDPYHLLFLDYPTVVHYHELRKAKRTKIFIPTTLALSNSKEFSGVLIDLSGLGCLCQVKSKENSPLPKVEVNAKINLRCLLPGLKGEQELKGEVKNIKKNIGESWIGIEFTNLQEDIRESIERYVYSVESING